MVHGLETIIKNNEEASKSRSLLSDPGDLVITTNPRDLISPDVLYLLREVAPYIAETMKPDPESIRFHFTGSRAFGTNTDESKDWDFAVFVGQGWYEATGWDDESGDGYAEGDSEGFVSLRAVTDEGREVNVLAFRSRELFDRWATAHNLCRQLKPATRSARVAIFKAILYGATVDSFNPDGITIEAK